MPCRGTAKENASAWRAAEGDERCEHMRVLYLQVRRIVFVRKHDRVITLVVFFLELFCRCLFAIPLTHVDLPSGRQCRTDRSPVSLASDPSQTPPSRPSAHGASRIGPTARRTAPRRFLPDAPEPPPRLHAGRCVCSLAHVAERRPEPVYRAAVPVDRLQGPRHRCVNFPLAGRLTRQWAVDRSTHHERAGRRVRGRSASISPASCRSRQCGPQRSAPRSNLAQS